MGTESLIEWFKKRGKDLKKAVASGDQHALVRAVRVIHNHEADFGHMKALHVIAVEAGFKSWKALLEAGEDELRAGVERFKS